MTTNTPPSVSVDGYEGFERIGSGGFSAVYRARQASMGRDVALKVLNVDVSSPADRRAFERECHALGLLSRHPNIVTVYSEAFATDGRPCIVMELYSGNYRQRLDTDGPLPISEALALGVKMCGALDAAHQAGILHRDLKPHNIFMSDYGEPALGDFGISTIDDERSISAASGLSVAYAAPEVLEDASATALSDVYSLAASVYHLVEGAAPFASKQMRTTVRRILTEAPAEFTRSGVPDSLAGVLERAMAKDPAERFRTAQEFGEALRAVEATVGLDRTPIPLRRDSAAVVEPIGDVDDSGDELGGADVTIARPSRSPGSVASEQPELSRRTPKSPKSPKRPTPDPGVPPKGSAPRDAESSGPVARGDEPVGHEETVRRASRNVPAAPNRPEQVDQGPSVGRRRVAVALSVAVLAVIGVLALTVSDGGEEAASTTTALRPGGSDADPDVFVDALRLPAAITVEAAGDGTVLVDFAPVAGAESYEIESITSPAGRRFTATEPPVAAPNVQVGDAPCWKLIIIGARGRIAESPAVCAVATGE